MSKEGATLDAPPDSESTSIAPQVETSTTPKRIRIRNGIFIPGASLLLLEIILRAMGLANPLLYETDPNVGYRIKPNQQISYLRNPITINSFGVRDARPLTTRDPNKKRVLCLGDSVTWGGIYERQENLFTSVAEHRLGNIEIVNAGVNGYSARQMAELYNNFLTPLEPDLIVLCVIARDFERPPRSKLTGNGVAFPTQKPVMAIIEALRICQISAYERWNLDWLEPASAAEPDWLEQETYEESNLEGIVSLAKTIGNSSEFLVVFIPIESGERTRFRRNFSRNLQNAGIKVPPLAAELNHEDYVDGVHLSTSGHAKIGSALAAVIDEVLRY